MRIGVYPGTFDPVTLGHLDIIERSLAIFDKVIVGVAKDNYKQGLFNYEERIDILKEVTKDYDRVEVHGFSGLLMDYCDEIGACAVIRGLRAVSDFEYEMQMELMNRKLNPNIETIYLMTSQEYSFISSTLIKGVASLGGQVKETVPAFVEEKMKEKYKKMNSSRN